MERNNLVKSNVTKKDRILEFAPYYCPLFPKSEGYNVDVVDVYDRKTLIERAQKDPFINDPSKIEEVIIFVLLIMRKLLEKQKNTTILLLRML